MTCVQLVLFAIMYLWLPCTIIQPLPLQAMTPASITRDIDDPLATEPGSKEQRSDPRQPGQSSHHSHNHHAQQHQQQHAPGSGPSNPAGPEAEGTRQEGEGGVTDGSGTPVTYPTDISERPSPDVANLAGEGKLGHDLAQMVQGMVGSSRAHGHGQSPTNVHPGAASTSQERHAMPGSHQPGASSTEHEIQEWQELGLQGQPFKRTSKPSALGSLLPSRLLFLQKAAWGRWAPPVGSSAQQGYSAANSTNQLEFVHSNSELLREVRAAGLYLHVVC